MIIDSSALVAIFRREPEQQRFVQLIAASPVSSVAAPTFLETAMVLRKFGPQVSAALHEFVRSAGITILPFAEHHLAAAEEAFRRFGRGAGHAARLNFGDCISYAVSITSNRPLLFKGDDFTYTDVMRLSV